MKTKLHILLIIALSLVWLILPQAIVEAEGDYYVDAINGDDSNPGTLENPFRTIQKARDTIRETNAKGLTVYIRKGVYYLSKPLEFNQYDSGNTYQSYPGEKVVISGGKEITGWNRYSGNIFVAHIPEVKNGEWNFNSLFVNDKRATRAREPDTGYYIVESVDPNTNYETFNFSNNDINGSWHNLNDVEVVYLREWTQSRLRIDRVVGNAVYFQGTPSYRYWSHNRYYVENVFEGLDEPGEWYLDKQTGDLYYWPLDGQNPQNSEIIIPLFGSQPSFFDGQILNVKGTETDYVENLTIEGLTFAHTDWYLPDVGYAGWQSAWMVEVCEAGNPAWRGVGPAISFIYTQNCKFNNNTIIHTGVNALNCFAENMEIIGNEITDVGANGIRVGTWDPYSSYSGITGSNIITDNTIHDIGIVFKEGTGILVLISGNNTIAHNLIYNVPYTGISMGWGWSDKDTACKNNIIEYNEIYNVVEALLDGAGIYLMGKQPGTVVRNNKIHDIPIRANVAGLYIDEGGKDIIMRDNWVYRTNWGLLLHSCSGNFIENNVFVSAGWSFLVYNGGSDNSITKNIVYSTEEPSIFRYYTLNVGYSNYNLFYNAREGYQENWDNQLKNWRTNTGFDMNSLEEDPLFVDYAGDDFTLKLESPAFGIGFQEIDMSNVGPRVNYHPEESDDPLEKIEPEKIELTCYNNVFNPTKGEKALIRVEIQNQSHVRVNLYNTRGNKIKELADEQKEAGSHKYYWDGRSGNGNVVGSGLYFVHIQAGDYRKTKKIVVVK